MHRTSSSPFAEFTFMYAIDTQRDAFELPLCVTSNALRMAPSSFRPLRRLSALPRRTHKTMHAPTLVRKKYHTHGHRKILCRCRRRRLATAEQFGEFLFSDILLNWPIDAGMCAKVPVGVCGIAHKLHTKYCSAGDSGKKTINVAKPVRQQDDDDNGDGNSPNRLPHNALHARNDRHTNIRHSKTHTRNYRVQYNTCTCNAVLIGARYPPAGVSNLYILHTSLAYPLVQLFRRIIYDRFVRLCGWHTCVFKYPNDNIVLPAMRINCSTVEMRVRSAHNNSFAYRLKLFGEAANTKQYTTADNCL